jgi:hypothetical protein
MIEGGGWNGGTKISRPNWKEAAFCLTNDLEENEEGHGR